MNGLLAASAVCGGCRWPRRAKKPFAPEANGAGGPALAREGILVDERARRKACVGAVWRVAVPRGSVTDAKGLVTALRDAWTDRCALMVTVAGA